MWAKPGERLSPCSLRFVFRVETSPKRPASPPNVAGVQLPPIPGVADESVWPDAYFAAYCAVLRICRRLTNSTQQYYRDIPKFAGRLKAEVADLQQHETPRKEPGQAKKEIQTGSLKGAATTAAAHIAESAASLFGSGKEDTGTQE